MDATRCEEWSNRIQVIHQELARLNGYYTGVKGDDSPTANRRRINLEAERAELAANLTSIAKGHYVGHGKAGLQEGHIGVYSTCPECN